MCFSEDCGRTEPPSSANGWGCGWACVAPVAVDCALARSVVWNMRVLVKSGGVGVYLALGFMTQEAGVEEGRAFERDEMLDDGTGLA